MRTTRPFHDALTIASEETKRKLLTIHHVWEAVRVVMPDVGVEMYVCDEHDKLLEVTLPDSEANYSVNLNSVQACFNDSVKAAKHILGAY